MDFKKISRVYNNNKFLCIINENKARYWSEYKFVWWNMDKKRLFLSQPFLSITFKTFSFPFPRKTSFIQSQNPFKERVSPDLRQKQQRHNTFGTHLSLKKTTERERERESLLLLLLVSRCTRLAPLVSLFSFGVSIQGGARVSRLLFR